MDAFLTSGPVTAESSAPKDVRSEGDCCAVRDGFAWPSLILTSLLAFGRAGAADWGLIVISGMSLYIRPQSLYSPALAQGQTLSGTPRNSAFPSSYGYVP